MNFLELIRDKIPAECGVDKAYGRIAEIIFWRECEGDPYFHQANFEKYDDAACRERVKCLYMGYVPEDWTAYNHYLDLLELCACYHRQDAHGDDWAERISFLEVGMSDEEKEWAVRGWWNG